LRPVGAVIRENQIMQAIDQIPGLRERKKIRTRETIRREAFRLIQEHGYAATTVEQIAEAAEVSPSTFFRYFPTKESVLLADDMDPMILDALEEQPADLSPSQAVRRAYQAAMANLSEDQREFENTRQRLMFSIPELKAAMYDEYYRTITTFAEAVGRRIGRDAGDFELRVFAGALTGAMMAVYEPGPHATDTVLRALDFVDAGMPLT
jgi:AcrR family transcriptional regulator